MRKFILLLFLVSIISFFSFVIVDHKSENLRRIYSRSADQWPAPSIDDGILWKELGVLPASPIESKKDSLKEIIELGKILFFDPRLSGSGKISCASCHQPELSWTDGKIKSVGHEGSLTKRNSPTIQNSWFYENFFWDGRAKSLQDQAFAPINSETEMHHEMPALMGIINKSGDYHRLFKKAFGDDEINPDRLTEAIAVFEKTIISRRSRFDEFLAGKKSSLTNSELKGLHLFRTKARCMNCHNGALFSDNKFHNNGFAGDDKGVYQVTHKEEDLGKMKTPSLRDVMKTGPWMHDGSIAELRLIIDKYNSGNMTTGTDKLIRPLGLSKKEKKELLAFLNAISATPVEFQKPVLPTD